MTPDQRKSRIDDIRLEISAARYRIREAETKWAFESDGDGENWKWVIGFTLVIIGGAIGSAITGDYEMAKIATFDFFGCCLPVMLLTCMPVYVKWRSGLQLGQLGIELAALEASSGGDGADPAAEGRRTFLRSGAGRGDQWRES